MGAVKNALLLAIKVLASIIDYYGIMFQTHPTNLKKTSFENLPHESPVSQPEGLDDESGVAEETLLGRTSNEKGA